MKPRLFGKNSNCYNKKDLDWKNTKAPRDGFEGNPHLSRINFKADEVVKKESYCICNQTSPKNEVKLK